MQQCAVQITDRNAKACVLRELKEEIGITEKERKALREVIAS